MSQTDYTFTRYMRDTWRPFAALLMASAALPATVAACAGITSTERDVLTAGYEAACAAATLIPIVGGFVASACHGEEATVKAALEHAVIATGGPDGGVGTATAAMVASAAPGVLPSVGTSHVALYHKHNGHRHRRHVGYAPAHLAPAAQAWLDAHPEAGGGDGGCR